VLNNIRRQEGSPLITQKEFIRAGFTSLEQRYTAAKEGKIIGIPTGFRELDLVTGGWQPDYYIIAGRPSMGKTAFAEQARDAAARHFLRLWEALPESDRPLKPESSVGMISIEMGKEPLALRAISRKSKVPLSRILAGTLHDRDWAPMSVASGELHNLPIYYEFESSSASRVSRKVDELVQKHGAKLIVIDYIQLMDDEQKHGNREQEISAISRMIKHKVAQHKISVLALAQLSRKLEDRPDKRPLPSDLRESGSLEQDADIIIFLYREEVYKPCICPRDFDCLCGRRGAAQLLGRKGRMIGTWDISLRWNGNVTTFSDAEG
jgi:replicative DNA helicase